MYYSRRKKKKIRSKALHELRGKEKVLGTLTIKGFQTIEGVSRKLNSKENKYSDLLPDSLEASISLWFFHWQNKRLEIRAAGNWDHLAKDTPFSKMETQVQPTRVKLFLVEGS